jgi:hypothetical protein
MLQLSAAIRMRDPCEPGSLHPSRPASTQSCRTILQQSEIPLPSTSFLRSLFEGSVLPARQSRPIQSGVWVYLDGARSLRPRRRRVDNGRLRLRFGQVKGETRAWFCRYSAFRRSARGSREENVSKYIRLKPHSESTRTDMALDTRRPGNLSSYFGKLLRLAGSMLGLCLDYAAVLASYVDGSANLWGMVDVRRGELGARWVWTQR